MADDTTTACTWCLRPIAEAGPFVSTVDQTAHICGRCATAIVKFLYADDIDRDALDAAQRILALPDGPRTVLLSLLTSYGGKS